MFTHYKGHLFIITRQFKGMFQVSGPIMETSLDLTWNNSDMSNWKTPRLREAWWNLIYLPPNSATNRGFWKHLTIHSLSPLKYLYTGMGYIIYILLFITIIYISLYYYYYNCLLFFVLPRLFCWTQASPVLQHQALERAAELSPQGEVGRWKMMKVSHLQRFQMDQMDKLGLVTYIYVFLNPISMFGYLFARI